MLMAESEVKLLVLKKKKTKNLACNDSSRRVNIKKQTLTMTLCDWHFIDVAADLSEGGETPQLCR